MKRFFVPLFALLLLIGAAPVAYAQEIIPEVSTLTELQDAITQAEAGDTIKIMQTIVVDEPTVIGESGKPITLCAAEEVPVMLSFEGDWGYASWCTVTDLTFDGEGLDRDALMIVNAPNAVYIHNSAWRNATSSGLGSALRVIQGECYVMNSSFENCSADLGGAIYFDANTTASLSECTFIGNHASRDGGAIYSMVPVDIMDCTFTGNSSEGGSGGALAGMNCHVGRCTITGNQALYGGGLFLSGGGTVENCKLYDNTGELSAADLLSDGTVAISADDYNALFAEDMTAGEYDSFAWYVDVEDNRYTEDNKTEALTETDSLTAPALKFVLYKEAVPEPEPEPEPTPEPEPEPTPDPKPPRPSTGGNHRPSKPEPPKEPEPVYPTLACGKAVIDRDAVIYLTDALKRFTPAQEQLTRGKFAALLYGVLSDESRAECDRIAVYSYDDLYGSPYEDAVAALTGVGVFCGDCSGLFRPADTLTYGQFLTALTRFVEPQKGYIGSFNVLDHWAAPAAITAASMGWIEDAPINMDAPATHGSFVNLLAKIFEL